jgi:ParB-like nuclease domain
MCEASPQLPTQDLDVIRSSLSLVDIASLSMYEQPDDQKIAEIVVSLGRIEALINPVIVDPSRKLLVDGHHRVRAFELLKLKRIPAYTVDYLSSAVAVRGWSRATMAPPSEVREAFEGVGNEPSAPWSVVAMDSECQVVACCSFRAPMPSAWHLEHISQFLLARGHTVLLVPTAVSVPTGRIHSYVDPVIGKEEVLEAINQGQTFSREVNRHLVDGRPLSMHIPLDDLTSSRDFKRCIDEIFEYGDPVFMSGVEQEGRRYEERVTMFTERTRGF